MGGLAELDPQQQQAVTLPAGHVLVLAGAGSGKTRVLTQRIAWLIEEQGLDPGSIMAVTFTNKAAREMRERLAKRLDGQAVSPQQGVWLGTFHSIAHRLLRRHAAAAGLPSTFQILDAADQLALVKRLLKAQGVAEAELAPKALVAFINSHKEQGLRPGEVNPTSGRQAQWLALWQAYEELCTREGVVDFAGLLLHALALLKRDPVLRASYRRRFAHILVDEFQDTNPLQYRWLQQFARQVHGEEDGAWLFCVGDDDQSIYGFRGAMSALLAEFQRSYGAQLVRLERNYRSVGNILTAANAIIARNERRLGKTLWTDRGEGEPIRTFGALDEGQEARFVVSEIAELIRAGHGADEIAILYRTNALSRLFEHHLLAAGIPYRVYGGMRFFDRLEVKHLLAYLRLMVLPEDTNALLRVINVPARGIGTRTVEALLAELPRHRQWEEAARALTGRGGAAVARFAEQIAAMRSATAALPLPEAIAYVAEASGLRAYFAAGGDEGGRPQEERLENLDALVAAGHDFVAEMARDGVTLIGHEMVTLFLQHAALESGEVQADPSERAVRLMTIHAAKGLEFDAVFLVGLEEGLFPHENALVNGGAGDGLEEERRLMYVAVTRAKKRLYLSWAASRMWQGTTRYRSVSRFVDEIPAEICLSLSPRLQHRQEAATAAPWQSLSGGTTGTAVAKASGCWRIGQTVRHPKFGEGVILALEGSGAQQQASVRFGPTVGVKRLLLSVAPLEVTAG